MFRQTRRTSFVWTLFLIFLFTAQVQDSEATTTSFKLKKLLKKVLLLKALSGKKAISIIPIPIPLNLVEFLKEKLAPPMEKMPPPMPMMPPYPMAMGYPMMPKEDMSPPDMKIGSSMYGMMSD